MTLLPPGLRCFYHDKCKTWRYSRPFTGPTSCDGDEDCLNRRCRLNIAVKVKKASGRNVVSGSKECYEQITGQQNGCYRQDYRIDQPERERFRLFKKTWGGCAAICKRDDECGFWSWASTSCSNCVRGMCTTFMMGTPPPLTTTTTGHQGHISGSRHCQDIGLESTKSPDRSKVHSALVDPTPFPTGFCRGFVSGMPGRCPAQEVPGYRWYL